MSQATAAVTAMGPGLTPRQRLFVTEYMTDRNATRRNATQAAIRAGYSKASARQAGSALLSKPAIAAEIARLEADHLAHMRATFDLSRDRVLRQIAIGAFADIRSLYDSDGNLIPPHKLTSEQAAMIEGIEHTPFFEGHGQERRQVGWTVKYKLAKRQPYVDMAMKHLGEYKRDNEQAGAAMAGTLAELVNGMQGSTLGVVKAPKVG